MWAVAATSIVVAGSSAQVFSARRILFGIFFLYGVALLYGYSGTITLAGIADTVESGTGSDTTALIGVGLLSVGLLFKIGAVPFHSWTPDVYQAHPPR